MPQKNVCNNACSDGYKEKIIVYPNPAIPLGGLVQIVPTPVYYIVLLIVVVFGESMALTQISMRRAPMLGKFVMVVMLRRARTAGRLIRMRAMGGLPHSRGGRMLLLRRPILRWSLLNNGRSAVSVVGAWTGLCIGEIATKQREGNNYCCYPFFLHNKLLLILHNNIVVCAVPVSLIPL